MKNIPTLEEFILESMNEAKKDIVTFMINDEKLDQLLHDHHGRELDYVKIKGDEFYTLPRRDFDRFIDAADSKGFDVDYEESEDAVLQVYESNVNEATTSWSKMMKGVKSGDSGPWSIVAIENKKVVGQKNDIKTKEIIPAHYESMRKEFPKAKIHIEDAGGHVVWVNESSVNEAKIIYQKGKSYQTGNGWVVYADKSNSGIDIKVNNSAGWQLDPHDTREEDLILMDAGRQRASITFKEGNINAFAKKMWDMNDKTTWGEKQGLTADDYADIIRVWIDMRNETRK